MVKQSSSLFTILPKKDQTKHFVELFMSSSPLFHFSIILTQFCGIYSFQRNQQANFSFNWNNTKKLQFQFLIQIFNSNWYINLLDYLFHHYFSQASFLKSHDVNDLYWSNFWHFICWSSFWNLVSIEITKHSHSKYSSFKDEFFMNILYHIWPSF